MRIIKLGLLVGAFANALFFTGCATVTRGTSEQLMVQSTPSGASVRLSSGFTGVTPVTFTVPRKGDIVVTLTKEGYETHEVTLKSGVAGKGMAGFAGNVLIGGLIGGGIDIATGATLSHTPNPLHVTLVTKTRAPEAMPPPVPPIDEPKANPAPAAPPSEESTVVATAGAL